MRDRERGVPRYNKFRQLLGKAPVRSFDELTSNKIWAEEIRELYGGDIDRVDTQVGMFAEDFPEGFGFSDTGVPSLHSDGVETIKERPLLYYRLGTEDLHAGWH